MTESAGIPLGRFLALNDVADLLSLSASEVLALVHSGELPAIRLGTIGQWRIEQGVLESYIADKYEETRRLAAWNEVQYAEVTELFGDRRGRPRGA